MTIFPAKPLNFPDKETKKYRETKYKKILFNGPDSRPKRVQTEHCRQRQVSVRGI